jgi:hypothetical protein
MDPGGQRCYRAQIPRPILQDFCCLYALFPWYNISAFHFSIIDIGFLALRVRVYVSTSPQSEQRRGAQALLAT